jgi:hypothetical protein
MPGFDGTGPMGQGPFTGRAMGYCALPVGQVAAGRSAAIPTAFVPRTAYYYPMPAYAPGTPYYAYGGIAYPAFWGRPRFGGRRGFGRGGGRRRWW